MDISNIPRFNWTVDETNGDITGKINFCLAHQILPPIPKLCSLKFHLFTSGTYYYIVIQLCHVRECVSTGAEGA